MSKIMLSAVDNERALIIGEVIGRGENWGTLRDSIPL